MFHIVKCETVVGWFCKRFQSRSPRISRCISKILLQMKQMLIFMFIVFRKRLENKLKKQKFQKKVDVEFYHSFPNSRYILFDSAFACASFAHSFSVWLLSF